MECRSGQEMLRASYQEYEEQALQWEQSVEHKKRYLCGPKLIQEMSGTARKLVTGKRPDWLSFNGGVAHLMKHLRSSLGRPQIPELSEYLNRYFKQSRRRKFETMNQYIVRRTEVYQRAKQALARVLPQQQSSNRGNYQWPSSSWKASSWRGSWRSATTSQDDGTRRALGAIIDFEEDLVVFRRLDDRRMIQATRSQSGHQLLPLTENLYSKSVQL